MTWFWIKWWTFISKIWLRVVILLNICPVCFESCNHLELRVGMEVLILLEVMWQGTFFLRSWRCVRNLVLRWALERKWVFFWTASMLPVEFLQSFTHLKSFEVEKHHFRVLIDFRLHARGLGQLFLGSHGLVFSSLIQAQRNCIENDKFRSASLSVWISFWFN